MKRLTLVFVTGLLALPVSASNPGGDRSKGTEYFGNAPFTYEVFEASIEHADLEICPQEFHPDAVFCRLTLAAGKAHVFVFSYEGEQPLLAIKHYELGDGFLSF